MTTSPLSPVHDPTAPPLDLTDPPRAPTGDETVPSIRLGPRALDVLARRSAPPVGDPEPAIDIDDVATNPNDPADVDEVDADEVADESTASDETATDSAEADKTAAEARDVPPPEPTTGNTGNTGNTGHTGHTSRTRFLGAAIEEARRRSGEPLPLDAPPLDPDLTDDELIKPGPPRWLTRGAPAFLLLAISAISIFTLFDLSRPRTTDLAPAAPVDVTTTTGDQPVTAEPALDPTSLLPADLPDRGIRLTNLLAVDVQHVQPERPTAFLPLGDAIKRQRVTVINLWAEWCTACKQEFPDLKDMFEAAPWADRVRFVPLASQLQITPTAAHNEFAAIMPRTDHFLAEVVGSAATQALRADIEAARRRRRPVDTIAASDLSGLPITLLLDCRGELRLAHNARLTAGEIGVLRTMLDKLVAELGTDFCRPPRPATPKEPTADAEPTAGDPAAIPVQKPKARCGNNKCEEPYESCRSCAQDCACPANNSCRQRTDSTYACLPAPSSLK